MLGGRRCPWLQISREMAWGKDTNMICGSLRKRNSVHKDIALEGEGCISSHAGKMYAQCADANSKDSFLRMPVSILLKSYLALGANGGFFPIFLPVPLPNQLSCHSCTFSVVFRALWNVRAGKGPWDSLQPLTYRLENRESGQLSALLFLQSAVGRHFRHSADLLNLTPVLFLAYQRNVFFLLLLRTDCVGGWEWRWGRGNVCVCF